MTIGESIRRIAHSAVADLRSDGELLEQFTQAKDEWAFVELFHRHGPMVYGVCRRVLGNGPDADDAFQAVFLVLVRKAATIRPPGHVGQWLYGVSIRTARRANAMTLERKRRTQEMMRHSSPETVGPDPETLAIVDDELARLPEKYRAVIVACELEGQSRSAAAQHLGIPDGTVATRLAKARTLLASRLRQRGVAGSVGLFTAWAVPPALAAQTLTGVRELIGEGMAIGFTLPIQRLSREVIASMFTEKLRSCAIGITVGLVALLSFGGLAGSNGANPLIAESTTAPVPKSKPDDGVLWQHSWEFNDQGGGSGTIRAFRPTGEKILDVPFPHGKPWFKGLTPDGTRFVFGAEPEGKPVQILRNPRLNVSLFTQPVQGGEPTDLGVDVGYFDEIRWAHDGKRFYRMRPEGKGVETKSVTTIYTSAGKEEGRHVFRDDTPIGWTNDGQGLVLSTAKNTTVVLPSVTLSVYSLADKTKKPLSVCDYFDFPQLSPDGTRVLGFDNYAPASDADRPNRGALIFDLATKKITSAIRHPRQCYAIGLWSPDGSQFVFTRCELTEPSKGPFRIEGDWHTSISKSNRSVEPIPTNGAMDAWTLTPPTLKNARVLSR